jgi:HlyD family secretion protein
MKPKNNRLRRLLAIVAGIALLGGLLLVTVLYVNNAGQARAQNGHGGHETSEPLTVTVVKAKPGGIERTTTQPGTLRAFEHVEIYAKVSGYLKDQNVDIDSTVKKGQLLARIYAPELEKDRKHAEAQLEQSKAQKAQMLAHVAAAKAELKAAESLINQRKAEIKRTVANLHYREKQFTRVGVLVKYKSVDQKLVDEVFDQLEAALAWKDAAKAGKETAEADLKAKEAKVEQAKADLKAAEASIDVAQSALDRAKIFEGFTEIRSEYDGKVTERNYHNGNFIRPGDRGAQLPILVVQRRDKMRLIVQIPDVDVPYCNAGDPVTFSISTLPDEENKEFLSGKYKLSRLSNSQNQKSRTMRAEVDVPNPEGLLRDGMYGEVTIRLEPARKDAVHVPSSALRREESKGKKKVCLFVVREGKARRLDVRVGTDNGNEAEILPGGQAADRLRAGDLVINHPSQDLQDGAQVQVAENKQSPAHSH